MLQICEKRNHRQTLDELFYIGLGPNFVLTSDSIMPGLMVRNTLIGRVGGVAE